MPRKIPARTIRRHFQFFEDDLLYLEERWGPRSQKGLPVSQIVRQIVANAVKADRARQMQKEEDEALRLHLGESAK